MTKESESTSFSARSGGKETAASSSNNQALTAEQWQRAFAAVKASQGHPESRQAAFLAEACGSEAVVLRAAQSLLVAQQRMGSFLEKPCGPEGLANEASINPSVTATSASPTVDVPEALLRGTMVGRYAVLNLLGIGGMGLVYAAHDPELGRKVAIKLLHPGCTSKPLLGSDGRARLLREAQAMARLAHPNVIAVHDVGTFGDEVFIAMEYVDGYTLKGWLEAQRREWPEIISMFVQAGHGLSAAHSAGIVHRDFKPENVLVGKDGRARVVDFGLARDTLAEKVLDAIPASVDGHATHSIGENPIADAMTLPGTLLGTPAYMAPEQLAAGKVDARTDQFSFCASLFKSLYGEQPFSGDTLQQRLAAIREGTISEPKGSNVPGWLRDAVLKGLNANPADRYPSMEVLLHHLQQNPRKVWPRVIALAAIVLTTVLALLVSYQVVVYREGLVCRGAEENLAGIRDSARNEAIRRVFLATIDPNAPAVDGSGNAYVADAKNSTSRQITATSESTLIHPEHWGFYVSKCPRN
jgi:hypothetical protein